MVNQVILNFHGVGPIPRNIDDGERGCWLEQDFFAAVLDRVRDQPHVRLTVDDGNVSDVEIILPALLRRGLRATFFVCSGRVNQATFLSRAQVRELLQHNMGVGSHGVAHVSWRHLSPARLRDELEGSRKTLEEVCGRTVESAACPFGDYDRRVLQGLRRAGYRSVYTSDDGSADTGAWIQARNTVTRGMTLGDIERLVQPASGARHQVMTNLRKLVKRLR